MFIFVSKHLNGFVFDNTLVNDGHWFCTTVINNEVNSAKTNLPDFCALAPKEWLILTTVVDKPLGDCLDCLLRMVEK